MGLVNGMVRWVVVMFLVTPLVFFLGAFASSSSYQSTIVVIEAIRIAWDKE